MSYELHNIDCIELLKSYPDKSIDIIITDPNYGIGEAAGKNKSRSKPFGGKYNNLKRQTKEVEATDYGKREWDNKRPDPIYFEQVKRVSKNQIIFGGNYFADLLPASSCWIVWDKDNGDSDFADCELAWTSFKTAVRKFKYRWNGMLQGNMRFKEKREHPTQKPVPVMEWIIENYTSQDQTILDPFMGSGTTGVACMNLNRKFIGCEKEEDYFLIAKRRIEQAESQLTF